MAAIQDIRTDLVGLENRVNEKLFNFDSRLTGFEGRFDGKLTGLECRFDGKLKVFGSELRSEFRTGFGELGSELRTDFQKGYQELGSELRMDFHQSHENLKVELRKELQTSMQARFGKLEKQIQDQRGDIIKMKDEILGAFDGLIPVPEMNLKVQQHEGRIEHLEKRSDVMQIAIKNINKPQ